MADLEIEQAKRTRFRVFSLIVAALFILAALIFLLTGAGGALFERKVSLRTYMSDATGLEKNAPVRLNGILIGKIRSVELSKSSDPHRVIVVELAIKSRFVPDIAADSVTAISADNLLGDKYINISKGKSGEPVKAGGELRSLVSQDTFNQADLVASLQTNLKQLDTLLTQIESPGTQMGQFVHGEEFYDRLRDEIQGIQTAITSYASPRGEFGKSLYRKELYDKMRAPVLEFDDKLAAIQRGEGQSGKLLLDSSMYDDARTKTAELRRSLEDLNAGKGQFGKLLTDDEMYRRMQTIVKSMGDVIDAINSGEGKIGEMLASSQLYESLNGSSKEMKELFAEFRSNPRKFMRIKVF